MLVARTEARLGLSPPGPELLALAARVPYRLDATGLHQDTSVLAGLGPLASWEQLDYYGAWPDQSSIVAVPEPEGDPDACREETILNWSGSRWQPQRVTVACEHPIALAPWKEGRMLAVVPVHYRKDYRFALARGKGPIALPAPTAAARAAADADDESVICKTVSLPQGADGTPAGHLFVVGRKCEDPDSGPPVVERFGPNSSKAELDSLPETGGAKYGVYRVFVRSESDAWVALTDADKAYLAHFDGKSWSKVAAPSGAQVRHARLDRSGALWLAQSGRVHRREPNGSWTSLELPTVDGKRADAVELSFAGDALWVVAVSDKSFFLFGPSAPNEVVELPSKVAVHYTEGDGTGPLPATAACKDLMVVLRRHVGASQQFKDVAAKLAGKAELAGTEYVIDADPVGDQLAAIAPSYRVGRRIVELMTEEGKPKPHFVCRKPKVKSKVSL